MEVLSRCDGFPVFCPQRKLNAYGVNRIEEVAQILSGETDVFVFLY